MRTLTHFTSMLTFSLALGGCGGSASDDTASTSPSGGGGSGGATAGSGGATAGGGGATAGGGGATAGSGGATAGSAGVSAGGGSTAGGGSSVEAFVFDTIDLGDAPGAWKTLGANIDGLSFPTDTTPGHCKPQPGAKAGDVVVDGTGGIDNSFAHNVLPIVTGIDASFAMEMNLAPSTGGSTYAVALAGTQAQPFAVRGSTAPTGAPVAPTDWSTYVWHPFSAYVADSAVGALPTSLFPHVGASDQGTWASSARADATPLTLVRAGSALSLPLRRARIVITPGPGGTAKGYLSAVVPTAELQKSFAAFAGAITEAFCVGSALEGVLDHIAQASDILVDGTQDPSKVCDGISIGIGFTARTSKLASPAPLAATNLCGG